MLAKFLGWFFIAMGILFVLKPEILRNKLLKKSNKVLRRFLFSLSVVLGILLINISLRYHGILPKIIMVLGVMAILKGFFLFKEKAADKILEWSLSKSIMLFRIGGCFHIVMGVIILNLR